MTSRARLVEPSALPAFGPAIGVTLTFVGFLILLPLSALALRPWEGGLDHIWKIVSDPRTLAALRVSFSAALIAACFNAVFGTIVAWTLVRYDFPGRRIFDAFVDLPFALPTAVAGIALAAIYSPKGTIGGWLAQHDITVAYTPLGIMIALIFVGFPFVVRSIEPVLADFEAEIEEAAATLGASRLRTVFHVIAPAILPAILSGFSLALARAIGEYGSVIFIAGNVPFVSEIAPLLIVIRLEEYDYSGAAAIGLVMLTISFALLFGLNAAQSHLFRRGQR